jgi:signal transduction histidine kinase
VVLVAVGFVSFVALTVDWRTLGQSLVGASVAAIGVALLAAPRLVRLANDLRDERRARIRSEEKAEIAAHLHDGVLQTLALIQRRAADNREVVALARRQERELREWLFGPGHRNAETLAGALAVELAAVEDDHAVPVELVCVGDAPLDEHGRALLAAVREAASNAARHSGADRVDVYVEVEPDAVSAFVRDRGRGFDRAAVPSHRRGLADSVVGRMRRVGGSAVVRSEPGEGTEVRLRVPRRAA